MKCPFFVLSRAATELPLCECLTFVLVLVQTLPTVKVGSCSDSVDLTFVHVVVARVTTTEKHGMTFFGRHSARKMTLSDFSFGDMGRDVNVF